MFTWMTMYAELAEKVLRYRDRQKELIDLIKEMDTSGLPVVSVEDKKDGVAVPLGEIDPFTFFACFNRGQTVENKKAILARIKEKLGLHAPVPTDFAGLPVVNNMKSWFFPYVATRKMEDIPSLWSLATAAAKGGPETLDPALFDRCLQITSVGPGKLTMGLFWLNPKQYVACDSVNQQLFKSRGIDVYVEDWATYKELAERVKAELGTKYHEVSQQAFELAEANARDEAAGDAEEKGAPSRFWAGGFQWGAESKLDDFTSNNYWQIGHSKDDPKAAAKKTWQRFALINVGDRFAIKGYGGRNDLNIHYLGEVLSKSDDGIIRLSKIDRPLYKGKAPSGPNWFDTLIPIDTEGAIDAIFRDPPATLDPDAALNLILYGPPGTGKTYRVVERAVQIIDGSAPADHKAHKTRYDELSRDGRVGFITFHQSYSYEDFIEGIRPVLTSDDEGVVPRYECRAGVFKRLATTALFDCLERIDIDVKTPPFETLWTALLTKIEEEPDAVYPGLTPKTSYQFAVTPRGNIDGMNKVSGKTLSCSRRVVEKVFEAKRDQDTVNVSEVMAVVARGCHASLVAAVFKELKQLDASDATPRKATPMPLTFSEDEKADIVQRFLEVGHASGYRASITKKTKRYVLVIDEINRGNISKILGELITLVEADKRLTGENSLVVTLPYSGDRFAVPPNLFVLATMNTTDKSIALVDLALRRRFEFEELHVDLSVCHGLSDEMRFALNELNRRIALRKDRDHQIGHAYFVNVSDGDSFNRIFRRQIVPLLQEYFFNDWEGLKFVLAESSSAAGAVIKKIKGSDAREARTKWQWYFDAGDEEIDLLQTLASNYRSAGGTP
jgi:5-methylcytosine-specific restriction protein B